MMIEVMQLVCVLCVYIISIAKCKSILRYTIVYILVDIYYAVIYIYTYMYIYIYIYIYVYDSVTHFVYMGLEELKAAAPSTCVVNLM